MSTTYGGRREISNSSLAALLRDVVHYVSLVVVLERGRIDSAVNVLTSISATFAHGPDKSTLSSPASPAA